MTDNTLVSRIIDLNDACNIDWIKNDNEFIGFTTINNEKYMFVLDMKDIEIKDMMMTANVTSYGLTIYNLNTNKKYKINNDYKNTLLDNLHTKILIHNMYRDMETQESDIKESINSDIELAAQELEEMIKKEKAEKEIVLKHLLEFVDDLCFNSNGDDTFDTDGDQEEEFVIHNYNGLRYIINRHILGYIIDILLEILDYYVIKSDNTTYVYFIYNGNIFEVGRMVGQGTYEYLRRVIDINEDDDFFKIINLKKVYNYYMENIHYD
ncbi:MAG: hypothetical protein IJ880_00965 [Bacilli bacterium]|nr:hypothetical protein [Bacilli bacterium]